MISLRRERLSERIWKRGNISKLKEEDINHVCSYLENPTKTGIWVLNFKWNGLEGISKFIKTELEEKSKDNKKISIGKKEWTEDIKRLTFIFRLFDYVYYSEKRGEDKLFYLDNIDTGDRLILEKINIEEIKKEYSEAFEYFMDNIHLENSDMKIVGGKITQIKSGFFIYSENFIDDEDEELKDENDKIVDLISLSPKPLEIIETFYKMINKISDSKIIPIYSPEEEVFSPYFSLFPLVYNSFVNNKNIRRLFEKSISEYESREYSNCINTIGQIAEDYLIQIYETLFRKICPKGLGLGQVYDLIHSDMTKQFKENLPIEPKIEKLYKSIQNFSEEKTPINSEENKEVVILLRDIVNFIKENNSYIYKKIKSINKKERITFSVFPSLLRENISELIKKRNSTSHRSRIPIGGYEALRTVYCCVTLILWWNKEKQTIKWKENSEEILKDVINRNVGIFNL
ncbi:MAG: hypothetical protein PHQ66_03655 [Candidatus Nanoarchaeia archaeon]|nr:hypothetical protein [Candidatus Nanoarchaeia archaeon]MDD5357542.1 hypothetical protein [Candidatus Nanoarchaeia archaeon]MDD5588461.1 hypothetical protein [Candidatus Nanoarchaeia archaeon]